MLTERASRVLGFPLVAIFVHEFASPAPGTPPESTHSLDGRVAFKLTQAKGEIAAPLPGEAGSEALEDFLRRQVKQLEKRVEPSASPAPESNGHLRQLQMAPENLSWPALQSARYLTLAPISCDCRGLAVDIEPKRVSAEAGWLLVGSEKALGPREEVLVLAVAQKLSELSRVARLESSIQLRTQFLSIASHELKTPLTSIYGVLQLQERMSRLKTQGKGAEAEAGPAPEQKRSYLKILIRQVERLNELIDGLLDVSRMQSGRFMVEPSETDVAAVLRDIVSSRLNIIASEAGVKLAVESSESLLAWVDPVRWEEVITNLVMNAIRFSPEGGVVWIRLREDGASFRLTVRDQGPSVAPEDRERIFQPFERAQRTSRLGGLGLGLYISRQIAHLHGGNVSLVESVPGKGNVFEAYMPIRNVTLISA